MMDVNTERLRFARRQAKLTQDEAAERAGVNRNTVSGYETGRVRPSVLALNMLATIYGKPVEWFFGKEGAETESQVEPSSSTFDGRADVSSAALSRLELLTNALAGVAREQNVSLDYLFGLTDDPLPISRVTETRVGYDPDGNEAGENLFSMKYIAALEEVAPAAGSGAEVYNEQVTGWMPFRRDWLSTHSIDSEQSHVLPVRGESMEPTLADGCLILVDRSQREPREGRIYVMRTEDGLVVKRLGKDDRGRWEVRSDNPDWKPVPLTYGSDIVGEVRWTARTF